MSDFIDPNKLSDPIIKSSSSDTTPTDNTSDISSVVSDALSLEDTNLLVSSQLKLKKKESPSLFIQKQLLGIIQDSSESSIELKQQAFFLLERIGPESPSAISSLKNLATYKNRKNTSDQTHVKELALETLATIAKQASEEGKLATLALQSLSSPKLFTRIFKGPTTTVSKLAKELLENNNNEAYAFKSNSTQSSETVEDLKKAEETYLGQAQTITKGSSQSSERQMALVSLENHPLGLEDKTIEAIVKLARQDQDPMVVSTAIHTLGYKGYEKQEVQDFLIKTAQGKSQHRADALDALGVLAQKSADPKAISALNQLAKKFAEKSSIPLASNALRGLGNLDPKNIEGEEVIQNLCDIASKNSEASIRECALDALGKLGRGSAKAINTLCEILKDTKTMGVHERLIALQALLEFTSETHKVENLARRLYPNA